MLSSASVSIHIDSVLTCWFLFFITTIIIMNDMLVQLGKVQSVPPLYAVHSSRLIRGTAELSLYV